MTNYIKSKMEYKSIYNSPIGTIILSSDGDNLTGLCFSTSRFSKSREINSNQIRDDLEIFKIVKNWLTKYFSKAHPNPHDIPIKIIGTNFSKEVWNILIDIPYGQTITYGEIANKIANKTQILKMSAQAVGYAVGHNPIAIIIPCHRVVGANGNLTGYGGGLDVKEKLLIHEENNMLKFYRPKDGNAL